MIVDAAVYTHGRRRPGELAVSDALEAASEPDSFAWVGLFEPSPEEFEAVRAEFDLSELAVEDATTAHQRPKLEVYGDTVFVVLKTARYDDRAEAITFAEIQLFIGVNFVVSVRHGEASALKEVRLDIERDLARMRCGPMAVLHGVMDRVVDDYGPVIEGLDNDLVEIEDAVFDEERTRRADPTQRIYRLKRQVLDFHRHAEPLLEAVERIVHGQVPGSVAELHDYFRDVQDHLQRVVAAIEYSSTLLRDALDANLARVTTRQNDDMRTISAWVAIGGVPTLVGAIYGMNFDHMPELGLKYSYYVVLLFMAVSCLLLHRRFKRIGWL